MSKLRLDYFLSLVFKLVDGDKYELDGDDYTVGDNVNLSAANENDLTCARCFITSFAPRKNTGEQPCSDDVPVVACAIGAGQFKRLARDFHWHQDGRTGAVNEWKPDLEALIKMQDEHDSKLAEPKPRRTKTEYVKVDVSAASNYHTNELFFQYGEEKIEPLKEVDAAFFIINQHKLVRKVELELTWQDEVVELYDDGVTLNTTLRELIDMNSEAVINISHLVASMTDNK